MMDSMKLAFVGKEAVAAYQNFKEMHFAVKKLQEQIGSYIVKMFASGTLTEQQSEQAAGLLYINNNIDRIADRCEEIGTVAEFSRKAQDTRVRNILIIYLVLLTGFMFWIQPVWGTAVIVTALLVFWFYRHKALKYFGGTTGDLSGYFLCLCEVWIVLVLAIITVVYKI